MKLMNQTSFYSTFQKTKIINSHSNSLINCSKLNIFPKIRTFVDFSFISLILTQFFIILNHFDIDWIVYE